MYSFNKHLYLKIIQIFLIVSRYIDEYDIYDFPDKDRFVSR